MRTPFLQLSICPLPLEIGCSLCSKQQEMDGLEVHDYALARL